MNDPLRNAERARQIREGVHVECPVDGCERRHGLEYVMCGQCWNLVSADISARVYRTWGARCRFGDARSIAAHDAAKDEAIAYVEKRHAQIAAARRAAEPQQRLDV